MYRYFYKSILFPFALLLSFLSVKGQSDSITHQDSKAIASPMAILPCKVLGETSPVFGLTYSYSKSNCTQIVSSWSVSGGIIVAQDELSVSVQWTSTGTGVVNALSGTGATLGTLTVSMGSVDGGYISTTTQDVVAGATPATILTAAASGGTGSFSYTWESASSSNGPWADVSSSNQKDYTPGALSATTYYRRRVISGGATAYTTNIAVVNVLPPLQSGYISPTNQNVNPGAAGTPLSVSAPSGGNGSYTYQWQQSGNAVDWYNISGATGLSYAVEGPIVSSQQTAYYRVITFSGGASVASGYVSVVTYAILQVGAINSPVQVVNYGTQPSTLSGTSVTGGDGTYVYQWQYFDGNTWQNIGGANSSSYNPPVMYPSGTQESHYRMMVTCNGLVAYSPEAVVTTYAQLQGGVLSIANNYINYNADAGAIYNSGAATGGDGNYNYQWYYSFDNSNWQAIAGATNPAYYAGVLTTTTYYLRQVTNRGVAANSNTVVINVYGPVGGGSISSANYYINYNSNPGTLSGTGGTGGNGVYYYQWYSSPDNASWVPISGANSADYTPGSLTSTTYYLRQLSSNGVYANSNSIGITVYPPVDGGTISSNNYYINYNSSPGVISGTSPSGGNGSYSYAWYSSPDNSSWVPIPGATDAQYTPGNLTATTYFIRQAYSNGYPANSNSIGITVYAPVGAGTISSANYTINYSTSPGTLTGSSPTGGNGTYGYIWYSSPDNVSWVPINGANGADYTPGNLTQTTYYLRQAISNGYPANSNSIGINVYPVLGAGSIGSGTTHINYATYAGTLSGTSAAGGNGTYSYQWYVSADGNSWQIVDNATVESYSPADSLTASAYYLRKVTSNGVVANSNILFIEVYPILQTGSISPARQVVSYNSTVSTLSIDGSSGGNGVYTYQWQRSSDNSTWTDIAAATGTTYTPDNSVYALSYYRVVVSSNGYSNYTIPVTVDKLTELVAGTTYPSQLTISDNTNPGTITTNGTSGGSGVYGFQWQGATSASGPWSDISTATQASFSPGTLTQGDNNYFRLRVDDGVDQVYTNVLYIKVVAPLIAGAISPSSMVLSSGSSATFTCEPAKGGDLNYVYQWQVSADNVSWTNSAGNNDLQMTTNGLTNSVFYRLQVNSNGETVYSNPLIITIHKNEAVVNTPLQNVDGPAVTQSVVPMPVYPTNTTPENINYVKNRVFNKAGVSSVEDASVETDPFAVEQNTAYYDGLGRTMQTVLQQASPSLKDMVSVNFYDDYGREVKKYLPFGSTSSDGKFKVDANVQQPSFYDTYLGMSESHYYTTIRYDGSPLNQLLKTTAAGKSWSGNDRGVSVLRTGNESADSVRVWNISFSADALATTTSVYDDGQLYKSISTDEDGHQAIVFTDKEGHTILKKIQNGDTVYPGNRGWLSTYYIYDNLFNLRCVLSPKATTAVMNNGWQLSQDIVNELCFSYSYDSRNRVVCKKAPGAAKINMVYDQLDRLVMTQDGNMLNDGKWLVTQFDGLSRLTGTGLWTDGHDQSYHAANANTQLEYPNTISDFEVLSENHYDAYDGLPQNIAGINATLDNTFNLTSGLITNYNVSPQYAVPFLQSQSNTGAATWSKTKILGTVNTYLFTVNLYDDRGRVIQVKESNYSGGYDVLSTQYNFGGKPIRSHLVQYTGGNNPKTYEVLTKMAYDHAGRITSVHKQINNGQEVTVAQNEYNELGQLRSKKLGQQRNLDETYNSNPIETLDYSYNIRGWLTGINRGYANPLYVTEHDQQASRYFGMQLSYDQGFENIQHNGSITGVIWKSSGDGEQRAYGFKYDGANRLLKADFTQNNDGWNVSSGIDFSMKMGDGINSSSAYDENGNILAMWQKGVKGLSSAVIDDLRYSYYSGSNKLKSVIDAVNDSKTSLGDFRSSERYVNSLGGSKTDQATDYVYDANGNLQKDLNKDIGTDGDGIVYNHLNLPVLIHVAGKGTIAYTYDANGRKLSKVTTDSTKAPVETVTTVYQSGFVYQNDSLLFVSQEEGRIRPNNNATGFNYDYFLKDNLGNVRMVLTDERKVDQYPVATLEASGLQLEKNYYTIDEANIISKDSVTGFINAAESNYQNNNGEPPYNTNNLVDPHAESQKLYRINGSAENKTGLGITLKVMAGDKIDIFGKSYYFQNNTGNDNNTRIPVEQILTGLLSGATQFGIGHSVTASGISSNPDNIGAITTLLNNQEVDNSATPQKPMAYINYLLFDEHFKCVKVGSSQIGENGEIKTHTDLHDINITKNGYIYVYCSNESPVSVFFDNLQVIHTRGAILEETHYYPFGLAMAGISSKAAGSLPNRYKFNEGTEFNGDFDINTYETSFRGYDAQTGRFNQIDPLADIYHSESPFSFAYNSPVNFNDPLGLEGMPPRFNNAEELLTYVQQNGISDFGEGFTGYAFGQNGATTSIAYDPNPTIGKNSKGENGIFVNYSYSLEDGHSEYFGSNVLDGLVVGRKFISANNFNAKWNDYLDYLKQNAMLDIPGLSLGTINLGLSAGENIIMGKLPRWAGGKGWWLGENLKFNRIGWGGNQWTGPRAATKVLNTKLGIATKALGIVTTVISAAQAVNDFQHGDTHAGIVHTIDTIAGVVGTFGGPVGAAVSGIYFISRFFWE